MKRLLEIAVLILIWLVAGAPGCGKSRLEEIREQRIAEINDSIRLQLGSNSVSHSVLEHYETVAIQKVKDLSDYWTIVSDTSADSIFRLQAAKMVKSLFVSDSTLIALPVNGIQYNVKRSVSVWIKNALGNQDEVGNFVTETVVVNQKFALCEDSVYRATIHFTTLPYWGNSKAHLQQKEYSCEVVVARMQKILGGKPSRIWTVALGEISSR